MRALEKHFVGFLGIEAKVPFGGLRFIVISGTFGCFAFSLCEVVNIRRFYGGGQGQRDRPDGTAAAQSAATPSTVDALRRATATAPAELRRQGSDGRLLAGWEVDGYASHRERIEAVQKHTGRVSEAT